jgi:hypothetical protein
MQAAVHSMHRHCICAPKLQEHLTGWRHCKVAVTWHRSTGNETARNLFDVGLRSHHTIEDLNTTKVLIESCHQCKYLT